MQQHDRAAVLDASWMPAQWLSSQLKQAYIAQGVLTGMDSMRLCVFTFSTFWGGAGCIIIGVVTAYCSGQGYSF
jgi:hypothetical protein